MTEPIVEPPSELVDRTASALVRSFQDPDHPRHCHQFYAACFDTIGKYDFGHSGKHWRRRHHKLFGTFMKLLTDPRTDPISRMQSWLTKPCECDLSQSLEETMHSRSAFPSRMLCDFVAVKVASGITDFASASPLSRSRSTWPETTADLVPHGFEATLDIFVGMIDRSCPSAFDLLNAMVVTFGWPRTMKTLLENPRLPKLFCNFLMTFEESDFGLHLDSYPVDQHPAIFNHTIALRKILDFAQQLAGCSPGAVLNFAERSGAPLYRYIGQLSRLLIIVQRVQDFAPRDLSLRSHVATHASMNEMLDHILAMCATFGATLETAAPPTRGTHYLPRISMLCDPTEYRWLPLVARLGITHRQAINNPRCFGPGCTETEATSMHKFHVCGACRHMQYCSRECQRRAWKHERVPHKPICKLIQDLEAQGIVAPVWSVEALAPAMRSPSGSDLFKVLQALVDHIDSLT